MNIESKQNKTVIKIRSKINKKNYKTLKNLKNIF